MMLERLGLQLLAVRKAWVYLRPLFARASMFGVLAA